MVVVLLLLLSCLCRETHTSDVHSTPPACVNTTLCAALTLLGLHLQLTRKDLLIKNLKRTKRQLEREVRRRPERP